MNIKLTSKVVIVTGGAKGIGEATVRTFAEQKAKVVLVDRDAQAGTALEKELNEKGEDVLFIEADLTHPGACEDIIKKTVKQFGTIDVLVNNAGVNDHVGLTNSVDDFMRSIHLNLVHCFELVKYAEPYLRKSHGKIVNVASKVAVTGQGNTSGYAAAKGGMLALTREWALEFAKDDVTVNAVIPAEVYTPLYKSELAKTNNPEAAKKAIEKTIPLGHRFTEPQEIANTIVFLGSSLADHITGQHIFVDGGYTHLDRAYTS